MSEWVETTLGDLTNQVRDVVKMKPAREYRLLGLRMYGGGAYLRETVDCHSSKASQFYRASTGQFIYNRMFAWGGSFGVVPPSLDGTFVSNEFPLFESDPSRLSIEYLRLYFQQPSLWDAINAASTGTTKSRNRWKESLFQTHQIPLPSLAEQHRIVDVMAAVDAQIEALAGEARSGRQALVHLIADSFVDASETDVPIVGLCSHVIGGVWGSPEGESEVDVLALGPRIYTAGTTDFVTTGSPMRSFSAKQVELRVVQPNDIILERSGGSPEQPVGRVVIAGMGLEPCVPTDFQRLMRPDPDLVEPRYLYWRLQHDWNTGLTRSYSRRTTGITNLSVKDYIARSIPVPSREVQLDLVARADALDASSRATVRELSRLRTFRSTLLSSMLSQEIEIPESYDAALATEIKVVS